MGRRAADRLTMNEHPVSAKWDYRTLKVSAGLVRSIADSWDPLMLVPVEPLQTTLSKIKEEGWEMTLMKDRTDSGVAFCCLSRSGPVHHRDKNR